MIHSVKPAVRKMLILSSKCEGEQDLAFRTDTGVESGCEDIQWGLLEGMTARCSMRLLAGKMLNHHGCWTACGREKIPSSKSFLSKWKLWSNLMCLHLVMPFKGYSKPTIRELIFIWGAGKTSWLQWHELSQASWASGENSFSHQPCLSSAQSCCDMRQYMQNQLCSARKISARFPADISVHGTFAGRIVLGLPMELWVALSFSQGTTRGELQAQPPAGLGKALISHSSSLLKHLWDAADLQDPSVWDMCISQTPEGARVAESRGQRKPEGQHRACAPVWYHLNSVLRRSTTHRACSGTQLHKKTFWGQRETLGPLDVGSERSGNRTLI